MTRSAPDKELKKDITELESDFFDTHVAYSVVALANLITQNTVKNTLAGTSLLVNEWRILRMAYIYKSITAVDVINLFGLDKTTTGRAITKLADAGLVILSVNPGDKRQTRISLSPEGKRLHNKIIRRDNISDEFIENILTQQQIKSFHKIMSKLRLHVRNMLD